MSEKRFKGFIYLMVMFLMMMLFGTAFTKGTYRSKKVRTYKQMTVTAPTTNLRFKKMLPVYKVEAPKLMERSY